MSLYFYYPPAAAMTRAIKKRLRQTGAPYRIGHLGELMEENYETARKSGSLRYRPEHLELLRGVRDNPEVVDVAFDVLAERLAARGVELPDRFDERIPYDPDYWRIARFAALLAVAMTVLITAAVVLVADVALMTTLIVLVSLVGAGLFVWGLTIATIPVDVSETGCR